MIYGDRILIIWKDVEKNCGLTGPHANDIVKMVNNMLATEWLADVSQCLEETLEAGNLTLKYLVEIAFQITETFDFYEFCLLIDLII